MKTLILLCLISSVFCAETSKNETKKIKRGIIHGNYFDGGLGYGLGQSLYPVAPFLPPVRQIPLAYPVPVERHIPVHVKVPVPVAVPVERHVPVHVRVPVAVPYPVERHIPVLVDRPVPVVKHVPVHVPVDRPVPVPVDRPVPVPVPQAVPVPQPYPVFVNRAQPVFPQGAFPGVIPNSLIPNGAALPPKEAPAALLNQQHLQQLQQLQHYQNHQQYQNHPQYQHHDYEVEEFADVRKDVSYPYHKPSHYHGTRVYRHYPKHIIHHKKW